MRPIDLSLHEPKYEADLRLIVQKILDVQYRSKNIRYEKHYAIIKGILSKLKVEALTDLSAYYGNTLIDTVEIPQTKLNIDSKSRSNPLKWNGQFSPQLVEVLLRKYAHPGYKILDPFLGSGTLLLEAGLQKYEAIGAEINPGAYVLSRTYQFINLSLERRRGILNTVSQQISDNFSIDLWKSSADGGKPLAGSLSNLLQSTTDYWQSALIEALCVLLDVDGDFSACEADIFRTWRKITKHLLEMPFSEKEVAAYLADARALPVEDGLIDLVITSPPYINVFNYHQQYRKSLEYLGYDLLKVAKSEIGANRKNRGNRFLTVIQYCLDMANVLAELKRVCRPGARIIIIVGRESAVRSTPFYNGQIVTEVAHKCLGLDILLRQERSYRNRFGQSIYEDVLHFTSSSTVSNSLSEDPRDVARNALQTALKTASTTVHDDIQQALQKLQDIKPSPLLDTNQIAKSRS